MSTQETNPGTVLTEIKPQAGDDKRQVNFFPVFPTLMAEVTLDLPVKDMVADALAMAGDTENYEGGFTTFFSRADLEGRPGIAELKEAIYNVAMVYADQAKFEVKREGINIHLWVSVIHPRGFHGHHRHPRSHLSGTFYAQVPENGSPIIFVNPTAGLRMNDPLIRPEDLQEFTAENLPITVKPNQMFVWPSWLEHFVPSSLNKAEGPRVAYSFNVNYIDPANQQ